ncbi:MAG: hypothetical protein NE330_16295 [Lentisphaeraceae bacterium]|nr:hypothetical protein [Lentisphaeraceae bacterium]
MCRLLLLLMLVSLSASAAKPSWKTFALHIDGISSDEEAKEISQIISDCDPKMIKSVKGLTASSGYVLIHHDHHNITFQKIAIEILKKKDVKVYTKLLIPDYQKVQGSIIGEKLKVILDNKSKGYEINSVKSTTGLFEVVINKGDFQGKGFNFGGLAHAISDPVVYGGLGLGLTFIGGGEDGLKGQMKKGVVEKELRFRKTGKKLKAYSKELLDAHKKIFNFPPKALAKFYLD